MRTSSQNFKQGGPRYSRTSEISQVQVISPVCLFVGRQEAGGVETCSDENKKKPGISQTALVGGGRCLPRDELNLFLCRVYTDRLIYSFRVESYIMINATLAGNSQDKRRFTRSMRSVYIQTCLLFVSKYFLVKIVVASLGSDRYGSRRQSRTTSNISKEGEKCQDYKAVKRKNRSKSFGAVFSEIDSTIQKNVKY